MFKEEYLKKIVIVWRKSNNFKSEGLILSENKLGIFVDDKKNGRTFIPFDDIGEIRPIKEVDKDVL